MFIKVIEEIVQPSGKVWTVGTVHEVTWDKAAELIDMGFAEHYIHSNPIIEQIEDRRSKETKLNKKIK